MTNDVLVPFPIEVFYSNKAGLAYRDFDNKLVVIRWLSHLRRADALLLVDQALAYLEGMGGDALIYDMRRCPLRAGAHVVREMTLICAQSSAVRRGVLLTCEEDVAQEPRRAIRKIVETTGARFLRCSDFDMAAHWLGINARAASEPRFATYGGSAYCLPELQATVIQTAGNDYELDLTRQTFEKAHAMHVRTGNKACIIDSSASHSLDSPQRYQFAFKELIYPLAASGQYRQIIHVRADEAGAIAQDAYLVRAMAYALGAPWFDVSSLEAAEKLLRILQGKPPRAAAIALTVARKARLAGKGRPTHI